MTKTAVGTIARLTILCMLVTFGTDVTHGYERTRSDSLASVARLLTIYAQSPLLDDQVGNIRSGTS